MIPLRFPAPSTTPRLGRWELAFDLPSLSWTNPFDPEEINVQAELTSPSGKRHQALGFYFQDYSRSGPPEKLVPKDPAHWRLRFSPDEEGAWTCKISAKDRSGMQSQLGPLSFNCLPSATQGYVKPSTLDPHYLAYSDDSQFIPIGHNLGWGNWDMEDHTYAYDRWLADLSSNGGNFTRVWMWSQCHGIEWKDTGLGDYSKRLDHAWRLDYALDKARDLKVQVMLMLVNHNCVLVDGPWAEFYDSPYSTKQGGPCERPRDFFSHPAAHQMLKRRLRYVVARWGGNSNLIWELCNEIDNTDDYIKDATIPPLVKDWHAEMSQYLRALDPRRLITTSFSRFQNDSAIWNLPEIGLTQFHYYSSSPCMEDSHAAAITRHLSAHPNKPHFGGEAGINAGGPDCLKRDPTGIHLHKSHWASLMSGACGSSLAWWWPDYVEPQKLERDYRALRKLTDSVDFLNAGFKPVRPRIEGAPLAGLYLSPFPEWGFASEAEDFTIDAQGLISPGEDKMASFLYGTGREQRLRRALNISLTLPQAGMLTLRLGKHQEGPKLKISDKAKVIWEGEPPHEADLAIPLAAGSHQLNFDNAGTGFIEVANYHIAACAPALKAYALQGPDTILAWVCHREWHHEAAAPAAVNSAAVIFEDCEGAWIGEWMESGEGKVLNRIEAASEGGLLKLNVPATGTDIVLKLSRR